MYRSRENESSGILDAPGRKPIHTIRRPAETDGGEEVAGSGSVRCETPPFVSAEGGVFVWGVSSVSYWKRQPPSCPSDILPPRGAGQEAALRN